MSKNKNLKKFLFNLYVYSFLDGFVLIYAVYTIMFVHKGLNTLQIGYLLAIWSGLHVALEIPSGVLADKYNRRAMLAAGQICKAIGFSLWLLFPTFLGLALGFIF